MRDLVTPARREWEGEPTTGIGVTHAAYVTRAAEVITHCGRYVDESFFTVPPTQTVTCLACIVRNKEA